MTKNMFIDPSQRKQMKYPRDLNNKNKNIYMFYGIKLV